MKLSELKNYSTRQKYMYGITFMATNAIIVMISNIQGPIFPQKAESKGLTPAEYGSVFGIFYLTMFVCSLLVGKHISYIGVKVRLLHSEQ